MRRRVDGAGGAGAIDTRLQDFLEVDPADPRYSKVTAILLDPSCSGSGIVSAPERLHDGSHAENDDDEGQGAARVKKLAAFQLSGLLKAMSFPQVRFFCGVVVVEMLLLVVLVLYCVCRFAISHETSSFLPQPTRSFESRSGACATPPAPSTWRRMRAW